MKWELGGLKRSKEEVDIPIRKIEEKFPMETPRFSEP
jgi:hypothetical protein